MNNYSAVSAQDHSKVEDLKQWIALIAYIVCDPRKSSCDIPTIFLSKHAMNEAPDEVRNSVNKV